MQWFLLAEREYSSFRRQSANIVAFCLPAGNGAVTGDVCRSLMSLLADKDKYQ